MSSTQVSKLDKTTHDQLCCTYASLILHDEGIQINANQIKKLIDASENKIDGFWAGLFAKTLATRNISELLLGGTSSNAQAERTEEVKESNFILLVNFL